MHDHVRATPHQRLHDALAVVSRTPVADLTDDQLREAVVDVYHAERQLAAAKHRLVAELDHRAAYTASGAQTAGTWITHHCDVPRGRAHHEVRVARSLRHLPLVERSLAAGEIGTHHADLLAHHHHNPRTRDALERDEAILVDDAKRLHWPSFQKVMAYWAQLNDEDGTEDQAEANRARRRLDLSQTLDGMWKLDGLLDPVEGTKVAEALRRIQRDQRTADDERTPKQRRADALAEMAQRAMSAPPGARRPAPLVSVLVGFETFRGRVCELADGTVVTPGTVADLLDEALVERIVFDSPSRVMDIGEQRCFTGALRRAIELRDRTCTHPDCDQPANRCDIDHIIPAAWGGPTTQANGRLLCPFHNHLRQKKPHPSRNGDDPDPA